MELTGERWIPGASDARVEGDHTSRYEFAAAFVAGKNVLDFACGAGAGSYHLAREGKAKSVTGMDVDAEAVGYAQDRFQWPGLSYKVGNLEQEMPGAQFDVVVSYETIEHVQNDAAAIQTLFRSLTPGGILILSTPNRLVTSPRADRISDKPENPFHVREYVLDELTALVRQAGFYIDQINGQRFRTYFPSGSLNMVADSVRGWMGHQPDFDSSPEVKSHPGGVRQPRNWVLVCRKQ